MGGKMDKDWEVLVVGAGPAGSGAAAAAAEGGAKTLLIDRKKEIGTPVQCGEVVGASLIRQLKLRVPPQAIASVQDHTRFILDRRIMITSREPYWKSVTLERKIFDKLLAARAAEAGASVQADTRLASLEMKDDKVSMATLVHRGEEVVVRPKVVIAADGAHSSVAKMMDLSLYPSDAMARGIEFEMVAKSKLPPGMQIFLEPEVGLGYGWIIPKGPRRANVGLGVIGLDESRRSTILEWAGGNPIVSKYFDLDQVLEVKSGDAPLPGFLGGPLRGNVLFAGDAAGQTLAFVGEGILPSFACGQGAGAVAAAAVRARSLKKLECYDRAVKDIMGEELERGGALKDAILGAWSDETLTEGQRTLLCGLIMSESIFPDQAEEVRQFLDLPAASLARVVRAGIQKRKARASVAVLRHR
ncbi:MAG: geranylgeranyl reductase family protein [Methanomassiliicoccus sp.]|nr:geranylgeranyl reductase family protein [Methanomassiliicoccus sp.]